MSEKNPLRLQIGDRVLIRHVSGTNWAKKHEGTWVQISRISKHGIPEAIAHCDTSCYRYVKPENVYLVKRRSHYETGS